SEESISADLQKVCGEDNVCQRSKPETPVRNLGKCRWELHAAKVRGESKGFIIYVCYGIRDTDGRQRRRGKCICVDGQKCARQNDVAEIPTGEGFAVGKCMIKDVGNALSNRDVRRRERIADVNFTANADRSDQLSINRCREC